MLTGSFTDSHESFEAFHFKYSKRVHENRENMCGNCQVCEKSVLR